MRKFPRSLVEALRQGRVLPFVGAGVSRSVHDRLGRPAFPTWVELLERAGEWLREEQKPEEAERLGECLGGPRPDFLTAAQIARAGLSGRRWGDFLRRQFNLQSEQIEPSSMELARAIWSLGSNLLITTNYDRVLEWACERSTDCHCWPTHAPAEHTRALEGKFEYPAVWHLHGTIQQLDSIILTTEDYQRLYPLERGEHVRREYDSALSTLRSLLAIKHFLFIGFGFNDHYFLQEVLQVNEAFRGNVGPHYALIHGNDRERMLPQARELGLELICFEDFGAPLVRTIRELASARQEEPAIPSNANAPIPTAPAEPRELRPGFLLGQRFRLKQRLGHGGFATVWQAVDERDQTPVAVKILHSHLNDDSGRIARFRRGAERMSALQHPNVVKVLAPVAADGPFTYFVMELMPIDLHREVLRRRPDAQKIVSIVLQVGDALSYAHHLGLVHRDVKPCNILLDARDVPRLTDFDLVLVRDSSGGTRTGGLGTFLFAAPEVIADPAGADETADVFGLAMTAVFMFHGAALRPDAYRNATEFIEQNLQCKREVKTVLARGCAWNRERRQRSIAEFCEQLRLASLAPEPSHTTRPFTGSVAGIIHEHTIDPQRAAAAHRIGTERTVVDPRRTAAPPAPVDAPRPAARRSPPALASARPPGARGRQTVLLASGAAVAGLLAAWVAWEKWSRADEEPVEAAAAQPYPPTVEQPPAAPTPEPSSPTPPAESEALRRLRQPPTGSTRGVTRTALLDAAPMRFIELTGGEFTVGSPSSEPFRDINETQHRVHVEPFLLAENEVTWRQWQAVMGATVEPSEFGGGPEHPVQGVSWHRAIQFLNLLSQREGRRSCYEASYDEPVWGRGCDGFRLPTEMEFEYALRAGSTTPYSFGEDPEDLPKYAWFADNAGDGPRAVRSLTPNQWGFYDMNGNVWEWVWDRYAAYPPSIPLRHAGPEYGDKRILRGGSFHDPARELRSANRVADYSTRSARYRGLRVAMDVR